MIMKKMLYVLIVSIVFGILSTNVCKAEDLGTKIPGDSVRLFMICYDTTIYPTLATPDSVSYYRYKAGVYLDSTNHVVPTAVKTGVIIKTYAARIDSLGEFYVIGRVKKGGKEGGKTWTWKVGYDSTHVKSLPDSILTRAKFKDLCFDSSTFANAFWVDVRRLQVLSGTQTFNMTGDITGNLSGKVTVADSTAGDVSYIANTPNDYKATGFLTQALLESDTTYTHLRGVIDAVAKFLGATDGYYQKLFPLGSANKDSVGIFNSSNTKLGTIYYFHTGSIIDSLRFEKW